MFNFCILTFLFHVILSNVTYRNSWTKIYIINIVVIFCLSYSGMKILMTSVNLQIKVECTNSIVEPEISSKKVRRLEIDKIIFLQYLGTMI